MIIDIIRSQIKKVTETQFYCYGNNEEWIIGDKKIPENLTREEQIRYMWELDNNYRERISLLGTELFVQIDDVNGNFDKLLKDFFNKEIIDAINSKEISLKFHSINEQIFWHNKEIVNNSEMYCEYRNKIINSKEQITKILKELMINIDNVDLSYFNV